MDIRRGQGMLDYVIMLVVVVSAMLVIGFYVRNSMSGKIRETADSFSGGETYAPNVDENIAAGTNSIVNVTTWSERRDY